MLKLSFPLVWQDATLLEAIDPPWLTLPYGCPNLASELHSRGRHHA